MRATVKDIYRKTADFLGQTVTLHGWVRTVRDNKSFGFIELNDGSYFKNIQVVFANNLSNFADIAKIGLGSSMVVTGEVVESPGAKQPFELKAEAIEILGDSPEDYPIQKKRHTLEYLRTIAHLRPRTNMFSAVFRVRSLAAYAIHKYFNDNGYVYCHSPIITACDAEGAGQMFSVTTLDPKNPPLDAEKNVDYSKDFFGRQSYLTVTGQFQAETFAMAFGKTYTFGPTFRAENSNTTRHAAEFWMIEPEIAFADLTDNMAIAEEMTKFIINYVLENAPEEMEFLNNFVDKGLIERLQHVATSEFAHVTYTEAIEILKEAKTEFQYPVSWGMDIQTEHERFLAEIHFKRPVFVTDYPKDIKAFYMRMNDDGKTVAAMDLLAPGIGEIIGGSQREERYDMLEKRIAEMGLHKEDYWWYLELRRFGGCVHSGYGLGFERLVMYLTGVSNIRDVTPYPRTAKNAEF